MTRFFIVLMGVSIVCSHAVEQSSKTQVDVFKEKLSIKDEEGLINSVLEIVSKSQVGIKLFECLSTLIDEYKKKHKDATIILEIGDTAGIFFSDNNSRPISNSQLTEEQSNEFKQDSGYMKLRQQASELEKKLKEYEKTDDYKIYIQKREKVLEQRKIINKSKQNKSPLKPRLLNIKSSIKKIQ